MIANWKLLTLLFFLVVKLRLEVVCYSPSIVQCLALHFNSPAVAVQAEYIFGNIQFTYNPLYPPTLFVSTAFPSPLTSLVPTVLLPEPSTPSQLLACQVIWINVLQIQQQIWEWGLIIMHAVVGVGRWYWGLLVSWGVGGLEKISLFLYRADSVGGATRRKLLCTKNTAIAAVLYNTGCSIAVVIHGRNPIPCLIQMKWKYDREISPDLQQNQVFHSVWHDV